MRTRVGLPSQHDVTGADAVIAEVWKALCVKDFVAIRVMVEDGKMGEEPASWRALHAKEQVLQDQRMEAILIKMRGSYKDHADSRGVVQKVDGLLLAKRRKVVVGSSSSSESPNRLDPTCTEVYVQVNRRTCSRRRGRIRDGSRPSTHLRGRRSPRSQADCGPRARQR
jgi:hypothetical protein